MIRINLLSDDLKQKNAETHARKLASARACYARDPERFRKANRDWYNRNAESQRARGREKRALDKDAANKSSREWWRKKNIKDADRCYAVLSKQNGVCAICGGVDDIALSADHDHVTGLLRGMLCKKHNTGLGLFQDDPQLLRAAAWYKEHPPAQPEYREDPYDTYLW